jgi:hypothetical protein
MICAFWNFVPHIEIKFTNIFKVYEEPEEIALEEEEPIPVEEKPIPVEEEEEPEAPPPPGTRQDPVQGKTLSFDFHINNISYLR